MRIPVIAVVTISLAKAAFAADTFVDPGVMVGMRAIHESAAQLRDAQKARLINDGSNSRMDCSLLNSNSPIPLSGEMKAELKRRSYVEIFEGRFMPEPKYILKIEIDDRGFPHGPLKSIPLTIKLEQRQTPSQGRPTFATIKDSTARIWISPAIQDNRQMNEAIRSQLESNMLTFINDLPACKQ